MTDLLVKLYTLPPLQPEIDRLADSGIPVRRALAPEKHRVLDWIGASFGANWHSEAEVTFARQPITCWIAVDGRQVIGFGCHEATLRNFFGPTGVDPAYRGRGIGAALLLACLHDQKALGYGYAIIGGAGPVSFYEKIVGAIPIPDSYPGVYAGLMDS